MDALAPLQLHIIGTEDEQANYLLSALRKINLAVNAVHIKHLKDFSHALNNKQPDLLLLIESSELDAEQWLARIKSAKTKVPLIIAGSENSSLKSSAIDDIGINSTTINITVRDKSMDELLTAIKHHVQLAGAVKNNLALTRQVHELEKQQRSLLDNSANPIAILRKEMHIYCNDRYAACFSCQDKTSLLNTSILALIGREDRIKFRELINNQSDQGDFIFTTTIGQDASSINLGISSVVYNKEKCLQICVQPQKGNNQYSLDKQTLASQDLLTRLNNLPDFTDHIETAIAAAINEHINSTLLLVCIDHFNEILEALGKTATNKVINEISEFLHEAINKSFTASRLADNEFGILLYDSELDEALQLGDYISSKVNSSLFGENPENVMISTSSGVAVINEQALDAEDMINRARINKGIMLSAAEYKNSRAALAEDIPSLIRQAITKNNFELRFQPIMPFDADDDQRFEMMSLLRGKNGAEILSAEFLTHANLHNLSEEIDKQIISRVFQDSRFLQCSKQKLFIQISSNSLVNRTLLSWLSCQIRQYEISASQLTFLISEIDIHSNRALTRKFCQGLDELGIPFCITHFGSAIDPLPVLAELKPCAIRLDEALIRDIHYSKQQQLKVENLIKAIHSQQARVLVTDIEELEMLPLLWETGVDFIQGACLQAPGETLRFNFPCEQTLTLVA